MRIQGERVVLRDWTTSDLRAHRFWLQPEHEWHRWDAPYFGTPSPEQADEQVAALRRQVDDDDWATPRQQLVVADRRSGDYRGMVAWYWESQPSDWRRLGIVLPDPQTWSGGLGTEAFGLWTSAVFRATDAHRLDFATWSGNERMCRLGRRLGFSEEARFREARAVGGRRYDSVVYGVLRREWTQRTVVD